jgi:hypothetical protein
VNKINAFFRSLQSFPETVAKFFQRRQQRLASQELEAERLDRIRNPEKYRGK